MAALTLATRLGFTGTVYGTPVSFIGDHLVQLQIVSLTGDQFTAILQWSPDQEHWATAHTWTTLGLGLNSLSVIDNLVAGYIRVVISPENLPANGVLGNITALLWPRTEAGMVSAQSTGTAPVDFA